MTRSNVIAGLAVLVLLRGGFAPGQFASPIEQPAASPDSRVGNDARAASWVQVGYKTGKLQVAANGANLNQILYQVARQTGMRISGHATDAQVYGTYGPGAAADVLSELLRGTGSNMLLTVDRTGAPVDLVLTPQSAALPPDSVPAAYVPPETPPATPSVMRTGILPGSDTIARPSAGVAGQGSSTGAAAQPQNPTIPDVYHRWPYQQQTPPQMSQH